MYLFMGVLQNTGFGSILLGANVNIKSSDTEVRMWCCYHDCIKDY